MSNEYSRFFNAPETIKITDAEFLKLTDFVHVNYGINLSMQRTFVEVRLQSLFEEHGCKSLTEYMQLVMNDVTGNIVADFISSLTVNYTLFNREACHFDVLTNAVLPELTKKYEAEKDLRIWSAGCATGEEPYTLAMVLSDYFNIGKYQWDTTILATDISTQALKRARTARYPIESIATIDPRWARMYFVKDPQNPDYVYVSDMIRNEVKFCEHNLVGNSLNFKRKFHVIFCRNVMIYFDESTRAFLIRRLYSLLEDGGYLFIGLSEIIDKSIVPFKYVAPSVYRKEVQ